MTTASEELIFCESCNEDIEPWYRWEVELVRADGATATLNTDGGTEADAIEDVEHWIKTNYPFNDLTIGTITRGEPYCPC